MCIALFLGYLYLCTSKEEYRITAKGAINHALSHLKRKEESYSQFSFYNGAIGIAYAASRLAPIFRDNSLSERAMDIILNLRVENAKNLIDIMSGNAGAIPVLVKFYDEFQESKMLELAISLGKQLLSLATKEKIGWSWNLEVSGVSAYHNLTGFSHGAAGIGYSLLEFFNKTGQEEFR